MKDETAITIKGPKSIIPYFLKMMFKRNYTLLSMTKELQEKYGDVVLMRAPFYPPIYQVTDPDVIGRILMATEKGNSKGKVFDLMRTFFGKGLLTATSADGWRANRRMAAPAFHPRMMDSLTQVIQAEAKALADSWEKKLEKSPVINLSKEMAQLTFTIICKALFGTDLSDRAQETREAIDAAQAYANHIIFFPVKIPLWVPIPMNFRIKKTMRILRQLSVDLIKEHRDNPGKYKDLLSVYLNARDEDTGIGMSDEQIHDEVLTLIIAGHETTAATFAMGFEALSREPEVVAKIDAEYEAIIKQNPWQADSYKQADYVKWVSSEVMRLYPALWSIARNMDVDFKFKGYTIPAGSMTLMVQYVTHRHPKYWVDPERFYPERFSDELSEDRHPFAYFPFGGGPRNCIGMPLARLELQVVMCELLSRFRFEPLEGFSYQMMPKISTVPSPNILVKVKKR